VSQAATVDRGAASGIYLALYFAGGMVGTAILGQIFDRIGWPACVTSIALALATAGALALHLKGTLNSASGATMPRLCRRNLLGWSRRSTKIEPMTGIHFLFWRPTAQLNAAMKEAPKGKGPSDAKPQVHRGGLEGRRTGEELIRL
jgi:hypothetical protein